MTEDEARWEEIKVKGKDLAGKVKELIREGNVRRLRVKNDKGEVVMDAPLTVGVVGVLVAPFVTGVAAVAALASQWTIEVQRTPAKGKRAGKRTPVGASAR